MLDIGMMTSYIEHPLYPVAEYTSGRWIVGFIFLGPSTRECSCAGGYIDDGCVFVIECRGSVRKQLVSRGVRRIMEQLNADGTICIDDLTVSERRFNMALINGLCESLSIADIAERCCLSVSTFKRHFQSRYNMPPHRWLVRHRIELAMQTILHTDLSLTSIAEMFSFDSVSYFVSIFKRYYGVTPSRLRRNYNLYRMDDEQMIVSLPQGGVPRVIVVG